MKKSSELNANIPEAEEVKSSVASSFCVGYYHQRYFTRSWHYHPEYELLLVTNGYGKRLVGDHSENFTTNDLILIGSNLAHAWISDADFLKPNSQLFCESIFVQFKKDVFGNMLNDNIEMEDMRKVLQYSLRGIKITGKNKQKITDLIHELKNQTGLDRLLKLIAIIDLIAKSDYEMLASQAYMSSQPDFQSSRMKAIHEYVMGNFTQEISIHQCAELVNMTISSFCRFFKQQTQMTFSDYINEIRIDFSQKLLLHTDLPIKSIAYECGYNSASYYNELFRSLVGVSPKAYRLKVPAI